MSLSDTSPRIDIDLAHLCANYRLFNDATPGAKTAAVVKCNGYGIGLVPASRALALRENCRTFFVAYPNTGAILRHALQDVAADAEIFIFNGPSNDTLSIFEDCALTPVLNSIDQARLWSSAFPDKRAALHIDTGMNRLGAPVEELDAITSLRALNISLVMSHLACSSEPARRMNERQRLAFEEAASRFPDIPKSLAASGGALMGSPFHGDMVRVGIGLYGASPFDHDREEGEPASEIKPVATLTAPVLQIRRAAKGETAGYSRKYPLDRPSTLATLALGYGDGFPRRGSNASYALVGGRRCPVAGRISMDLIILDITDAPEPVHIGDRAEFFGPNLAIEKAATSCGTIAYELLTGLGPRVDRRYFWNGEPADQDLLDAAC